MDGSVEKQVARSGREGGHPSWAPDGTEIAFVKGVEFLAGFGPLGNTEIVFMDVQTGFQNVLLPDELPLMDAPAWSPMGDKIAFSWKKPGIAQKSALYLFNRKRDDVARLVVPNGNPAVSKTHPVWSPDGNELIYEQILNRFQNRAKRAEHLFKINLRAEKLIQLTHRGENRDAAWFDPAFALPVPPQSELLTTTWGTLKRE